MCDLCLHAGERGSTLSQCVPLNVYPTVMSTLVHTCTLLYTLVALIYYSCEDILSITVIIN